MKTLIVVDVQNDFINPAWGHLYVYKGEEVVQNIIDYIKNNANELREVVFTLDWHPNSDVAFKEPNVTWPKHCLQYSEGAAIPQELINTCIEYNIPTKFFTKGTSDTNEHTEYGAFEFIYEYINYNDEPMLAFMNRTEDCSVYVHQDDEFVVCGVAGDYCVMNTIKNLMSRPDLNISVFLDGVRSIDGGKIFNDFIKDNNLKTI